MRGAENVLKHLGIVALLMGPTLAHSATPSLGSPSAPTGLLSGPASSVSEFKVSVGIGDSGGATVVIESGVKEAYVRLDVTHAATDYVEADNVSMARAAGGQGSQFNNACLQVLETEMRRDAPARTWYFKVSSAYALTLRIKKIKY